MAENSKKNGMTNQSADKENGLESPAAGIVSQPFAKASRTLQSRQLFYLVGTVVIIIIVVIVLLLSGGSNNKAVSSSGTDTWTGKGKNDNWSNASNWSSGVPKNNNTIIFNAGTSGSTTAIKSHNDITGLTVNSIEFTSGSTVSYKPVLISGQTIDVSSGGIVINTSGPITIGNVSLVADQSFVSQNKTSAVLTLGLNTNSNNLSVDNDEVTLNNLSGSGSINVAKGELAFSSSDKTNSDFSGNVSVASASQLALVPTSKILGTGSVSIDNNARLIFRLAGNATFPNKITLGSASSTHYEPNVQASSNVLSSKVSGSFTLTLSGNISLNNNAMFNASTSESGLVPVKYVLTHKPTGNFKISPSSKGVSISGL